MPNKLPPRMRGLTERNHGHPGTISITPLGLNLSCDPQNVKGVPSRFGSTLVGRYERALQQSSGGQRGPRSIHPAHILTRNQMSIVSVKRAATAPLPSFTDRSGPPKGTA